jgi:hypothetical protein
MIKLNYSTTRKLTMQLIKDLFIHILTIYERLIYQTASELTSEREGRKYSVIK